MSQSHDGLQGTFKMSSVTPRNMAHIYQNTRRHTPQESNLHSKRNASHFEMALTCFHACETSPMVFKIIYQTKNAVYLHGILVKSLRYF
jgi:hypothetical protein